MIQEKNFSLEIMYAKHKACAFKLKIQLEIFHLLLLKSKIIMCEKNHCTIVWNKFKFMVTFSYQLWYDLSRSARGCRDRAWCVHARSQPRGQVRGRRCRICRSFCLLILLAAHYHVFPRKNSIFKIFFEKKKLFFAIFIYITFNESLDIKISVQ